MLTWPTLMSPMTLTPDNVGILIRRRMRDAATSISQLELARLLGYSRSWVAQELLGNPRRVILNMVMHSPDKAEALAKALEWRDVQTMLKDLEITPEFSGSPVSKLSEPQRWAQTRALEDARDEARPGSWEPVYGAGFGPAVTDEQPEGEIWVDEETKRRYPGLIFNRIKGTCLEPDYPDNWIACIVPDPGLATSGSPVLVWWAGNGRVVKYLIESREDGDHKLYQPNPAEGETKTLYAPVGSQILGVVVDVRRGGSKKASMREMVEAIADERPDWLEEDQ
jgi:transcriptional regulator with XRE-family HTH domain